MQDRRSLNGKGLFLRQVHLFRQFPRVDLDPLEMLAGRVILGFNCQRKCFDGPEMEGREVLCVCFCDSSCPGRDCKIGI